MDDVRTPLSALVPAPRSVIPETGADFVMDDRTVLDAGPGTESAAHWLRTTLGPSTGLPLPPLGASPAPGPAGPLPGAAGVIRLRADVPADSGLGEEGYRLRVREDGVEITASAPAGVFWGAQTLRQLLGPEAYRRAPGPYPRHALNAPPAARRWDVPPVCVEDAPRFPWRGFMLDVARHFMPKDGVLRVIDLLAAHKLNMLHLHLTDDQGWRVEINRYPLLAHVGGWRSRSRIGHGAPPLWDERPHGGFYTQDDLREIVAYAAARHITVVPEIDVPGHSQAAIAAYPELGNTDAVDTAALEVWTDWGVNPNVLAPSDTVLRFYEGVLEEVLELFPSRWVHLGGDECPKGQWRASASARARVKELGLEGEDALQAWFIRHFDRWLARRGRRLVGWDEILEGGGERLLSRGPADPGNCEAAGVSEGPGNSAGPGDPGGAVVSSWRGYAGGIAAARAGHGVVMCPEQQVYLDHRQDEGPDEPVPIGYVRTLGDVYRFEPVPPQLAGTPQERRVLGAQANMWTECTESQQRVDYQVFPRLVAFAEVVWSALPPPGQRDFAGFERRMAQAHYARLDALGVDYRPPAGPRPWQRRPGVPGRPLQGPPPVI
jgi:hexosaminidase